MTRSSMIYLLIKRRVDFDDYPMSEIVIHAFTTKDKLDAYRLVNKLENDPFTNSNRTVYEVEEVELD